MEMLVPSETSAAFYQVAQHHIARIQRIDYRTGGPKCRNYEANSLVTPCGARCFINMYFTLKMEAVFLTSVIFYRTIRRHITEFDTFQSSDVFNGLVYGIFWFRNALDGKMPRGFFCIRNLNTLMGLEFPVGNNSPRFCSLS
jgi:hypothetical protein